MKSVETVLDLAKHRIPMKEHLGNLFITSNAENDLLEACYRKVPVIKVVEVHSLYSFYF
jgi:hypothetical protein